MGNKLPYASLCFAAYDSILKKYKKHVVLLSIRNVAARLVGLLHHHFVGIFKKVNGTGKGKFNEDTVPLWCGGHCPPRYRGERNGNLKRVDGGCRTGCRFL